MKLIVRLFLIGAFVSLGSESAFAFIVGNGVKNGGEPWVCRVLFLTPQDEYIGLCSASLVEKKELQLAAHCFDKVREREFKTEIDCGYIDDTAPERRFTHPAGGEVSLKARFKHRVKAADYQIATLYTPGTGNSRPQNDEAKIILSQEIPAKNQGGIDPISVATLEDLKSIAADPAQIDQYNLVDLKLRSGADCRIAGYGINNEGGVGSLKNASIGNEDLLMVNKIRLTSEQLIEKKFSTGSSAALAIEHCLVNLQREVTVQTLTALYQTAGTVLNKSGLVTSGDSGGPLYCRKNEQSPWKLVGINSFLRPQLEVPLAGMATTRYETHWASPLQKNYSSLNEP